MGSGYNIVAAGAKVEIRADLLRFPRRQTGIIWSYSCFYRRLGEKERWFPRMDLPVVLVVLLLLLLLLMMTVLPVVLVPLVLVLVMVLVLGSRHSESGMRGFDWSVGKCKVSVMNKE